ncbi:MAG: aspartyl protease family protein [Candidatus Zixiibacteriota bacterium]|nr:MAG: aspartyl protease family protein [candidate division Zixibacteria bacterium]
MRFVISLFVYLMLTASPGAVELQDLLLKSVGGEEALNTLRNLKAVKSTGRLVLNGQEGEFLQYFAPPDKYYMEVNFAAFNLIQAYDGKTAWQKDLNGQVSHLEAYARRELLQMIYFESFGFLFSDSMENEIAFLGTTEIEDMVFHEVAFFPFKTDTLYAYYDTTTSLRAFTLTRIDQLEAITVIQDYRDVSGMMIPFYSMSEIPQAQLVTETFLDTVELNVPLPDGIFSPPDELHRDYLFPAGVTELSVPFKYSYGHIRMPIIINGQKQVWMILDSGASTNIFHSGAVENLFLSVVGSLPAMGMGGYEEVALVQTDSVQIGELSLYGQVAGRMDLGNLAETRDDTLFGGLLGYDFLSRFPVEVNYAESTITVYNPETFKPDTGGFEIPFHLTIQIPTIEGEINGVSGDFIVDLGNAFGLVIHPHFAQENMLKEKLSDIRELRDAIGGIGGVVKGRSAYAESFRMGEVVLESIRVLLPESNAGMVSSEELAGNIGNMVWENFRVLLDYGRRRLILYPDSSEN